MDNLVDEIVQWQLTDYRWLKIQTKNDPQLWIGMDSSTKNGPT
jgi:predicted transglutaminase-like cysteine proteinase